jgi:hypothetical protein
MELVLKTLIADVYSTGTFAYILKAMFHLKDKTYEFLSPIELLGIDARYGQNIAGFRMTSGTYFNAMDYVFEAGHIIKMEVSGKRTSTDSTGKDTFALFPIMLARTI